jgi:hypothetical protein
MPHGTNSLHLAATYESLIKKDGINLERLYVIGLHRRDLRTHLLFQRVAVVPRPQHNLHTALTPIGWTNHAQSLCDVHDSTLHAACRSPCTREGRQNAPPRPDKYNCLGVVTCSGLHPCARPRVGPSYSPARSWFNVKPVTLCLGLSLRVASVFLSSLE